MENYKDTAVICYLQSNPPTKVHQHFYKKLVATALALHGDPLIFLSQDYSTQQYPMPWSLKVDYVNEFFGKKVYVCKDESVKTLVDIFSFLYQRHYKKVVMLSGTEYIETLEQFVKDNHGKGEDDDVDNSYFKFDSIEIVSSGKKDPDNEQGNPTYSPAQARNAVLDQDLEKFKSIVMANTDEQALKLFNIIKIGMGLTEHILKRKRDIDGRRIY